MRVAMLRCLMGFVAAALFVVCSGQALAQSSKLIQNMDTNKDGKVSREEMPEGATRRMFDNMVEKYKLDPKKTYTIQELEQVMGLGGTAASNSLSGNSSSRPGSSRRGASRNGPTSRAPSDGRPFRALEELPEPYKSYDKDGDGQIGLYEWPRDRIREFIALDVNDDGFLTINELKKSSNAGKDSGKDKKDETKKSPPADQESS